jgi:hypothetical protein
VASPRPRAAAGRRQPAGRGRVPVDPLAGGDHGSEPVAAADGEVADRGQAGDGQVALLAVGGAEVQAGRQVDDRPGLQLAVGDRLADVRHLGAAVTGQSIRRTSSPGW